MTNSSAVSLCGAATVFVVQDVSEASSTTVCSGFTKFTYGEPTFYAGVERDDLVIHLGGQRLATTGHMPYVSSLTWTL
jgi:hypothetical protein